MKLQVKKADVWAGQIKDRPGALAEKLAALSAGGVNLGFLLARRRPEAPGKAIVFLSPIKGARQARAAAKAGFAKTRNLRSLRVEGDNRRGLGAKMARALAGAGINVRGLSASAIGKRFVAYIALDKAADAAKALKALKKIA